MGLALEEMNGIINQLLSHTSIKLKIDDLIIQFQLIS